MTDYIVRAAAADYQIRAFAATTKGVAETARKAHNTSPVATAALGRLLTAGAMMGSMMKGADDVLTLKIKGSGPLGGITVTADSSADVKGYVNNPMVLIHAKPNGKLDVSGAVGKGELTVIRDIGMKEPYVGQTALVSGEIAEDLTYYYAVSEQTPSSVALGVLMDKDTNTVRQAGGFIIQLMPDASEEVISALEKRLGEITSVTALLESGMTPEDILKSLLGDMGLQILDRMPARFHCNCSKERVRKAVVSVGRKELENMIAEGKPIEVNCHFCNKHYVFQVPELEELLKKAQR